MPNALQFLTVFGQVLFGTLLVALIMSGIYAWYEWYGKWRARRPMSDEQVRALIRKNLSPQDILMMEIELGDLAILHGTHARAMIASGILAYGGVQESDADAVAEDVVVGLNVTQAALNYDSDTRRTLIAKLSEAIKARPSVGDNFGRLIGLWHAMLETAEKIAKRRAKLKRM